MKQVTVVLCFFFSLQLFSLNKNTFDVTQAPLNSLAKSSDAQTGYWGSVFVEKAKSAYSMMLGGYFTLGTTDGLSSSPFDNDCQLSYGHPYALTSYPILSIDGTWSKPDNMGMALTNLLPQKDGDTISLEFVHNRIHFSFNMQTENDGHSVEATLTLRNDDVTSHRLGMALVFDPALGQWGDGHMKMNGELVTQTNMFTNVPNQIQLWERDQQPLGMGLSVDFGEPVPDRLTAANWHDVASGKTPAVLTDIYDLCLTMIWDEHDIAAGAEKSVHITFTLQEPDFSSDMFLRWDMPTALSLEQNILFPATIRSTVRAMNTSGGSMSALQLSATYPDEFEGTELSSAFVINSNSSVFLPFTLQAKERYEDMIVPVSISCTKNGQEVDKLTRHVFIPATPVSDEGLIVSIDSTITDRYPQVSLVFSSEKEESGQRLLNLQKENIFLYDNESRVREFGMQKYGGGGSQLADVCFVLDCSGSMGDDIAAVRNNLGEFADSLRERGYDFRVAVITFSTTVDDIWDFTNDIELTKQRLAGVDLWGGVEDSPAALYKASELSWRPGSKRNIIWVTDEPYPEHTYTKEQIVNRMLSMDIKVHGVGLLELQTDWFNPIVLPTGGTFYNIQGNFRDVLLEVARMKSQDRYLLTFNVAGTAPHIIKLKIHYAGLGGQDQVIINEGTTALAKTLLCYPNPFNPVLNIIVDGFESAIQHVEIYNMLGQRVRHLEIKSNFSEQVIWNACDDYGRPVGSGFYIVKLIAQFPDGQVKQESQKILYVR